MVETTKVAIVENEPLFREVLERTLDAETGLQVVASTDSGEQAIRIAKEIKPDVILMDIELQGEIYGIEAAL